VPAETGATPEGTAHPPGPANAASSGSDSTTRSSESSSPGSSENPSAPAGSPDDATGTKQSATDQEATSSSATSPSGSSMQNAAAPVLGDGDLILKIATTEDAWLAVAADGKILMQRILPANSVRIFRAKDAFDVTTGNAEGTGLTVNGVPQKALGRHGEFRKVHVTRDGLQVPAKPPASRSNQ
jgi:Domain of unknown function (DUF4115)